MFLILISYLPKCFIIIFINPIYEFAKHIGHKIVLNKKTRDILWLKKYKRTMVAIMILCVGVESVGNSLLACVWVSEWAIRVHLVSMQLIYMSQKQKIKPSQKIKSAGCTISTVYPKNIVPTGYCPWLLRWKAMHIVNNNFCVTNLLYF